MQYKKIRTLVIDDSKLFHETFSDFVQMQKEPFEIIEFATNGNEGLQILHKIGVNNIDLILLDMQMKVMDGQNFLRIFKKLYKGEGADKVQILSNYANDDLANKIPPEFTLIPISKRMPMDDIIYSIKANLGLTGLDINSMKDILTNNNIQIDLNYAPDRYLTEYCLYIARRNVNLKVSGERTRIWEHIAKEHDVLRDNVRINITKKLKELNISIEEFTKLIKKNF